MIGSAMPLEQVLIGLLALSVVVFATATAGHALLHKRDTRAVIAWVGLIILVPLAGATMYWMLGVNRVRRRAVALRPQVAISSHGVTASIVSPPAGFEPLGRVGHPVRDLQFRARGPVVQELMSVFVSDWEFVARETLSGASWFPPLRECGLVIARAIPDGPDEYFEVLKMIILGALAQARHSVLIATPYFLPDAGLISALNTTALRGVAVNILMPERNNLKLVQWASVALYWQVLDRGCRIWHSPPPFDHSVFPALSHRMLQIEHIL